MSTSNPSPWSPRDHLTASAQLKLRCADELSPVIEQTGTRILDALLAGKKVLVCGNGGSAADAQHLASELVGRFRQHRKAVPAIALTADTSALTAISNDYGFDQVFARQVEALAGAGDILVAISTSGQSRNVVNAATAARTAGCYVIGLTGQAGAPLADNCDITIRVPSTETALVQEVHESIIHCWGTMIEGHLLK